jgi:hypothetical protein
VSKVVGYDEIPKAIRSLSPLVRPDYADMFSAATGGPAGASLEQRLREVFEDSPVLVRVGVPLVQRMLLGLRLSRPPSAPGHLIGWKIAERGNEWIRLEANSWLITAHIVGAVVDGHVCVATFVRYEHVAAALVWPPVSIAHRHVALRLMQRHVVVHTRGSAPRVVARKSVGRLA